MAEIYDGILRCNRPVGEKSVWEESFKSKWMLKEFDYKIHFAAIHSFKQRSEGYLEAHNVEAALTEQVQKTLLNVSVKGNKISGLPFFLDKYVADFGDKEGLCKFLLTFIGEQQRKFLFDSLSKNANLKFEFFVEESSEEFSSFFTSETSPISRTTLRKSPNDYEICIVVNPLLMLKETHSLRLLKKKANSLNNSPVQSGVVSPTSSTPSSLEESEEFAVEISAMNSLSSLDSIKLLHREPTEENHSEGSKPFERRGTIGKFFSKKKTKTDSLNPRRRRGSRHTSLVTETLFRDSSEEDSSKLINKTSSATDDSDMPRNNNNEILKIIQNRKQRNSIMEKKYKELNTECELFQRKSSSVLSTNLELKKKISKAIESVISSISAYESSFNNLTCAFYKNSHLELASKVNTPKHSHDMFSSTNEQQDHVSLCELLSERQVPLVSERVFPEPQTISNAHENLILISSQKTLRGAFEDSLKKVYSECNYYFWREINFLSKQLLQGDTLKCKLKQVQLVFLSDNSMSQIPVGPNVKKSWKQLESLLSSETLSPADQAVGDFLRYAKEEAENLLSLKVNQFVQENISTKEDSNDNYNKLLSLLLLGERDFLFELSQYEKFFVQELVERCKKGKKILSSKQAQLFGWETEQFISLHKKLTSLVQMMNKKPTQTHDVGNIFLSLRQDFSVYLKYAERHLQRMNVFQDLMENNKKFAAFVEEAELDQLAGSKVVCILMQPFEMLTRYVIFCRKLSQKCPQELEGTMVSLNDAKQMFSELRVRFLQNVKKGEKMTKLEEMETLLNENAAPNQRLYLRREGREFVCTRNCLVKDSISVNHRSEEITLHLFSDVLLFVSKKKNRYLLREVVPLEHSFVSQVSWTRCKEDSAKSFFFSLQVRSSERVHHYFLCFESETDAVKFCNTLVKSVKNHLSCFM